ncbi:MAG: uroporphyrinogen decarboxylase family protein [Coriobacteriales bacterium]|jgi:hypothetical protein
MPKREDRKLTAKENFLRMMRGGDPEWLPFYTMGFPYFMFWGETDEPAPTAMVSPSPLQDPHAKGGGKDCWGVNWVGNYQTGNALLPEPNNFMLDDVTKWHDVVKAPDLSDVDWEMTCKKDIEAMHIDRNQTALMLNGYVGAFQEFIGMMGFTEGLIAMFEEPEECAALVKYINDFYVDVLKHCMPYMKPDILYLQDDTCAAGGPFMSLDLFRQILLPTYQDFAREIADPYDIPIQFHNCGKATSIMDILHEEAHIVSWDPVQKVNDIEAFQKKWGKDFLLCGCWDPTTEILDPDCPDEVLIDDIKATMDKYGQNGGYAFFGMFVGPLDDESLKHKSKVMMDTVFDYGATFYD